MKKQIILSSDKKRELATTFKTTYQSVHSALTFSTDSGFAKTLRAAALQRGGEIVGVGKEVNCEFLSYFTEVPHQFIQIFSARVRLITDCATGATTLEVDSIAVKEFPDCLMSEMPKIQMHAQVAADTLR